jgi:hypothetical protein
MKIVVNVEDCSRTVTVMTCRAIGRRRPRSASIDSRLPSFVFTSISKWSRLPEAELSDKSSFFV